MEFGIDEASFNAAVQIERQAAELLQAFFHDIGDVLASYFAGHNFGNARFEREFRHKIMDCEQKFKDYTPTTEEVKSATRLISDCKTTRFTKEDAEQMVELLQNFKEELKNGESEQAKKRDEEIENRDKTIQGKEEELKERGKRLEALDEEIEKLKEQIKELDGQIEELEKGFRNSSSSNELEALRKQQQTLQQKLQQNEKDALELGEAIRNIEQIDEIIAGVKEGLPYAVFLGAVDQTNIHKYIIEKVKPHRDYLKLNAEIPTYVQNQHNLIHIFNDYRILSNRIDKAEADNEEMPTESGQKLIKDLKAERKSLETQIDKIVDSEAFIKDLATCCAERDEKSAIFVNNFMCYKLDQAAQCGIDNDVFKARLREKKIPCLQFEGVASDWFIIPKGTQKGREILDIVKEVHKEMILQATSAKQLSEVSKDYYGGENSAVTEIKLNGNKSCEMTKNEENDLNKEIEEMKKEGKSKEKIQAVQQDAQQTAKQAPQRVTQILTAHASSPRYASQFKQTLYTDYALAPFKKIANNTNVVAITGDGGDPKKDPKNKVKIEDVMGVAKVSLDNEYIKTFDREEDTESNSKEKDDMAYYFLPVAMPIGVDWAEVAKKDKEKHPVPSENNEDKAQNDENKTQTPSEPIYPKDLNTAYIKIGVPKEDIKDNELVFSYDNRKTSEYVLYDENGRELQYINGTTSEQRNIERLMNKMNSRVGGDGVYSPLEIGEEENGKGEFVQFEDAIKKFLSPRGDEDVKQYMTDVNAGNKSNANLCLGGQLALAALCSRDKAYAEILEKQKQYDKSIEDDILYSSYIKMYNKAKDKGKDEGEILNQLFGNAEDKKADLKNHTDMNRYKSVDVLAKKNQYWVRSISPELDLGDITLDDDVVNKEKNRIVPITYSTRDKIFPLTPNSGTDNVYKVPLQISSRDSANGQKIMGYVNLTEWGVAKGIDKVDGEVQNLQFYLDLEENYKIIGEDGKEIAELSGADLYTTGFMKENHQRLQKTELIMECQTDEATGVSTMTVYESRRSKHGKATITNPKKNKYNMWAVESCRSDDAGFDAFCMKWMDQLEQKGDIHVFTDENEFEDSLTNPFFDRQRIDAMNQDYIKTKTEWWRTEAVKDDKTNSSKLELRCYGGRPQIEGELGAILKAREKIAEVIHQIALNHITGTSQSDVYASYLQSVSDIMSVAQSYNAEKKTFKGTILHDISKDEYKILEDVLTSQIQYREPSWEYYKSKDAGSKAGEKDTAMTIKKVRLSSKKYPESAEEKLKDLKEYITPKSKSVQDLLSLSNDLDRACNLLHKTEIKHFEAKDYKRPKERAKPRDNDIDRGER